MVTNLRSTGKLLLTIVIASWDAFCILCCNFPKLRTGRNARNRHKRFYYESNYVFIHFILVYKVINDSVKDIRNVLSEFIPGFLSGIENYLTQLRQFGREIISFRKIL